MGSESQGFFAGANSLTAGGLGDPATCPSVASEPPAFTQAAEHGVTAAVPAAPRQLRGTPQSCGCARHNLRLQPNLGLNLTGIPFGRLSLALVVVSHERGIASCRAAVV